MAGVNKEEFPPILTPGFHVHDLVSLRRLCVSAFPDSITRAGIMNRLEALIHLMNHNGVVGQIWIDGSFLTQKLNPDDVDLLLILHPTDFTSMNAAQSNFFHWFLSNNLYQSHRCDNYAVVFDRTAPEGEWNYAYWLRQFGFSRRNIMKGVVVMNVPFLVTS